MTHLRSDAAPPVEHAAAADGVGADVDEIADLTVLRPAGRGRVTGLDPAAPEPVARRLHDLGFRVGTTVDCVRRAPLGSPTLYRVGESDICLRRREAAFVRVERCR